MEKIVLDSNTHINTIELFTPQLEYYFNAPRWLGMIISPAIKLNGYGEYDIPEGVFPPD